jgi:hypothetical protein
MRRMCVVGLAVAVAVAALLLSMSHASAQPVAGAYYSGEITGCAEPPCACDEPPCGTVDFTVSENGSQVLAFTAYDVPGNLCQFQGPQPYPPDPLPIVDNSFGPGLPGIYEVSGTFPSEGNAEGTLRLVVDYPKACTTGVLSWTAVTTTPSPTPVGGIAELPDVSDPAARDYVALVGLAAAALAALTAGAWWARRRWLS